jgi:hypothetical protein
MLALSFQQKSKPNQCSPQTDQAGIAKTQNRSPNDLGGVTPKCLKAAKVAMRPRGVRCK